MRRHRCALSGPAAKGEQTATANHANAGTVTRVSEDWTHVLPASVLQEPKQGSEIRKRVLPSGSWATAGPWEVLSGGRGELRVQGPGKGVRASEELKGGSVAGGTRARGG